MRLISALAALAMIITKPIGAAVNALLGNSSAKPIRKLASGRIGPKFYPGAAKYNITRPGQPTRRRK